MRLRPARVQTLPLLSPGLGGGLGAPAAGRPAGVCHGDGGIVIHDLRRAAPVGPVPGQSFGASCLAGDAERQVVLIGAADRAAVAVYLSGLTIPVDGGATRSL